MRKILIFGLLVTGLVIAAVFVLVPGFVERKYNPVEPVAADQPAGAQAQALHKNLSVVDLHADPLLWNRNLNESADYGQIDLPRLVEGNVAIQVFGLVTQSPRGQNVHENSADSDRITALTLVQAWPPRTWDSYLQRALYQMEKFQRFSEQSGGRLLPIRNQADLQTLLEKRAAGEHVVGGLLGLEGAHALEGEFTSLDQLYLAGLRMLGLTHFIDNAAAGSAHGVNAGGLSVFGEQVVRKAQSMGIIIDLAHASPSAIDETLAITTAPVVISHGGVRATCDTPRNLSDARIKAIAATGGVIGVGLFELATCGQGLDATVAAMRHITDLTSIEHVALGSDFNGAVATPIDAADWPKLTQALLDANFSAADIEKIMGGNALRVFQAVLPAA